MMILRTMTSTGGKITLDDLNKWSAGNYTVNFTVNTSKYWGNKTVKITIAKATPDFTVKDISLNISENDTIIINNIKSDPNPIFNNQSNNLSIARVIDGIVYGVGGGNTTITVTIMESENYTSLSKNLTVTVYKIATTINIDSPSVIIYAGQNQTTGASLYPSEAGELTYQSRDESIAIVENGLIIAKCEGNVIIEVSFAGNSRYAEAENKTIEVSVNLNNASVNVNNNTLDLEVEDNFTIIATTTPDGLNVNFTSSDDSVVTVDNEGNVKAIGKGRATITVSVGGDGVYVLNSTDVTVSVRDKPVPKKDLNITASTFTLGENVTVIVTGFENATGNVTVTAADNNYTSSIMIGMAFVSIPKSDKNITAYIYYPGDDNYNNASATVDIIAKKDLNITAIADQIFIGENATIIVNGFENATGNVSVIAGRGFYNASIINGTATVVTAGLNNSTTAYILYLGDDNYNMAFTSVNITVNPKSDVVIVAENVTKYYGGPERFIANIYDSELNPLVNKSVNITINRVTYTRKTDDNGTVSMAIRLGSGTYNVTTQVDNTTLKSSITVLSTVIGSDITKYYKNATQYSVQVYDTNGKAVGKGEIVTFNVNGVFYNRTTDENGIATLNINLPPSSYIITADYKGCRIANNITVLPVLNATDITMKFLDGTQFKANLVDGQGKPYKDQFITFNINGVLYNRLTDSNGQAALNIRLPPGEYIITSSFNGLNIANKITITG